MNTVSNTEYLSDPLSALRFLFPESMFSNKELRDLLPVCEIIHASKNQKIIVEDTENDSRVYFLLDGSLTVSIKGRFILTLQNKGDSIGEMGLISSSPRSATVTSDTDSTLLVLMADIISAPNQDEDFRFRYYFSRLFNTILTEKLRKTSDRARLYEDMVDHSKKVERKTANLQEEVSRYLREISMYTHVVDGAYDAIMVTDTAGMILSSNLAVSQIFGFPGHELLGRDISSIFGFDNENETRLMDIIKIATKGGWSGELDIKNKDGESIPADCSISMVKDDNQGHLAYSIILKDSRERKAYEQKILRQSQQLQKANQELQALDKAKNNFLHLISHHLRTPITSIKAYAELLTMDDMVDESELVEYLGVIHKEADKLGEMVNKVLALAKMESGQMHFQFTPCELDKLVWAQVSMTREKAEENNLILDFKDPGNLKPVVCDNEQIQEALDQVLDNAIKYTKSGSITVSMAQNDKETLIHVEDTGKGIEGFDVNTLLDRFTREEGLDARGYGLGLGLPLCYMIIKAHSGTLDLKQNKIQGITVTLSLPNTPPEGGD